MKGAYEKLRHLWPATIEHNEKGDPEKIIRYHVGRERLAFLQNYIENFAYKAEEDHEVVAYLTKLEDEDLDYRMPISTRYEYLAGKIQGSETIFLPTFGLIRLKRPRITSVVGE